METAEEQPPLPRTALSTQYGPGASRYDTTTLANWKASWDRAAGHAKQRQWAEAITLLEHCVSARADFAKGYVPLSRAYRQMGDSEAAVSSLHRGLAACAAFGSTRPILDELRQVERHAHLPASAPVDRASEASIVSEGAVASDVQQAALDAAIADDVSPPAVDRQSSLTSAAGASLLRAGFERSGWAWKHEATGTLVIESVDGGVPEVYNEALQQSDIDERVSLTATMSFHADGGWDADFGERLLRWIEDAIVLDAAAGPVAGHAAAFAAADARKADDEDARKVDVGLSRLPEPVKLGATVDRELTIYTWGDKVVSQMHLEHETGCTRHFNAKPLNGRGGGADLKLNATQDPRIVRNVASSMADGEGLLWLKRVVGAIEREDASSVSVFCSQGRHRSVSSALILKNKYYPKADIVTIKMR